MIRAFAIGIGIGTVRIWLGIFQRISDCSDFAVELRRRHSGSGRACTRQPQDSWLLRVPESHTEVAETSEHDRVVAEQADPTGIGESV